MRRAKKDELRAYERPFEIDPKCAKFWFFKTLFSSFLAELQRLKAAIAKAKELGFKEVRDYPVSQRLVLVQVILYSYIIIYIIAFVYYYNKRSRKDTP